jgi:hypothetical protein
LRTVRAAGHFARERGEVTRCQRRGADSRIHPARISPAALEDSMSMRSALLALATLAAVAGSTAPARASWSFNGSVVSSAVGDQSSPHAAPDGAGGAIVAWVDSRAGDQNIYAQRIDGNGARMWSSNDVAICTAVNSQTNPDVVTDGAGGAYILWIDSRNMTNQTLYMQHVTGAGAVTWTANGICVCDSARYVYHAALTSDGAGGAIVAWEDYRGSTADIYAQRMKSGGARSWADRGVAICDTIGEQTYPAVVGDGLGGAYVAWQDTRRGENVSDVYVQHVTSTGETVAGWPKNGRAVSLTENLQTAYYPVLARDGSSGVIVAWEDYRNVNAGVYALRLNAGNTIPSGWSDGGTAICDTVANQTAPIIAADGSGGVLVAWKDDRNPDTAPDLYAKRVTSSGATAAGWLTAGVPACADSGDEADPCIVADGGGGAIIAWYDFRAGTNTDIYAQHLTSTGSLPVGWDANGGPVCTAAGDQQGPTIVSDGGSGAIVAWSDYRSGTNYDIYATRITSGVLDAPPVATSGLRLSEPRPNPSTGLATLGLDLPAGCAVRAHVLDPAGRIVRTLEHGWLPAGSHALAWNGANDRGDPVAPGVYLVRVEAGDEVMTRRVVRLR